MIRPMIDSWEYSNRQQNNHIFWNYLNEVLKWAGRKDTDFDFFNFKRLNDKTREYM